jgi:hypothetical protein
MVGMSYWVVHLPMSGTGASLSGTRIDWCNGGRLASDAFDRLWHFDDRGY